MGMLPDDMLFLWTSCLLHMIRFIDIGFVHSQLSGIGFIFYDPLDLGDGP